MPTTFNLRLMSPLRRQRPLLLSLAFAASLLLSLLPTVGRLHQALNPDPLAAGWNAMCTLRGLAMVQVRLPQTVAGVDAASGEPGDGDPSAGECPYCPLLTAIALLGGLIWARLRLRLPEATPAQCPGPHGHHRHLRGLGPRGPPQTRIAI